ncbi:MAG: YdcF family protein [Chitinophagaceae bacterium]|nr:YdcF family protein [Chitinophagaceae bacterium]
MFFIFSKILLFLLQPFYWMVICLVLYRKLKKPNVKKRFLIAAISIFIVFSNYWLYNTCVLAWQPKAAPIEHKQQYELGIVLGGMTKSDKHGNSFFAPTSDRFLQTCKLYHTGIIKKILISGGDGSLLQNKPKEADFLFKEFPNQGISDSNLIVEKFSKNTYESALEAKRFVDSLHIKGPYVLITSAIHMKRSMATFKKAGLDVVEHPAGFDAVEGRISWDNYCIPKIQVLAEWPYVLKEMVGYWVYKITGKA